MYLNNHKTNVEGWLVGEGRKKYGKLLDIRGNFITFVVFYGDVVSIPLIIDQTF